LVFFFQMISPVAEPMAYTQLSRLPMNSVGPEIDGDDTAALPSESIQQGAETGRRTAEPKNPVRAALPLYIGHCAKAH
jgi:hypothetical protein